jgi:hypothetical protein
MEKLGLYLNIIQISFALLSINVYKNSQVRDQLLNNFNKILR